MNESYELAYSLAQNCKLDSGFLKVPTPHYVEEYPDDKATPNRFT